MSYYRLFYHVVWATKHRLPLITPGNQDAIFGVIIKKVGESKGLVHALNAMPDHVHLVANMPPTSSLATFVGQIKGGSSHRPANWTAPHAIETGTGGETLMAHLSDNLQRALRPRISWRAPRLLIPFLVSALAIGCAGSDQNNPPALTNVYTTRLSAYWQDVARFVEIDPDAGRIQEWWVNYDQDGKVAEHRLIFVAERETNQTISYTLFQSRDGTTTFDRQIQDGPPLEEVAAAVPFFGELDAAGLRRLEVHSGATHPVFMKLHTTYGSITYGQNAYIIENGRIAPPKEAGITLSGGHGTLLLSHENYAGPLNTYVFPGAVHRGG